MAIDLEKYRKATTTGSVAPNAPARPVNLEKYKKKPGVIPQPTPQQEQPGFLKSLVMSTGIPRFAANVVRIGQILTPGGVTAADIAKDPAKPVNMPWLGPVKPVGQEGTFGERLRDTFGESAKLAATVVPVGGGAVQVGKAALGGRILRGAGQGVKAGAIGGGLYGFGEGIQQKDATVGSVLGSTAIGAGLGAAGGGVLGTAFPLVGAGARNIYSRVTTPAITRAKQEVQVQFEKGVKPNLPGKTTPTTRTKYNNQIAEGVSVINNNKAGLQFVDDLGDTVTGRAPRTLKEFADSIEQTKDRIFTQYDNLATRAGDAGVQVDVLPIANELDQVINNKALQLSHPDAVAYAQSVQRRFQTAGPIDTKTAQEVIKNYNNSLQAFYRNPTPEGLTRNAVDAMMVNRIRKALDDGIEGLTGASYQALKNQYAALKAIERDVMRATLRDARRNVKGLIDYTDIFSGGQVVQGILSMNPATVASGVTQKAISSYFKYLNNPNRAIQKMFEAADRLPVQQSTIPLSTRKQLPAPRPGTPNVQVETPINLGARSQSTIDAQEMARLQSNQLPANSRRATMPAATMNTNVSRNVMPTVKQGTQPLSTPLSTATKKTAQQSQLFAGGAAGFEMDDNGQVTFSPEKALMGMAAMAGAQKLPRAELLKRLRTSLPSTTKDEMAQFVATIKSGAVKTGKDGFLTFASKEDKRAFEAGLALVNDRPLLKRFANDTLAKIAKLYDEVLDYNRNAQPGLSIKAVADTAEDQLMREARKYKTAEEFVKAQGTPVYHGTKKKFDTFRDPQGGYLSDAIFFAPSEYKATYYSEGITDDPGYMHEAYISPKAKLWDYRNADDVRKLKTFVENDTAFGKYLNENWNYKKADVVKKIKQGDYTWVQRPEIIKELKRLRYDGFVNVDHYPTGADISYGVFSSSNIKTRSQLTDIWNKANRK